MVSEIDGGLRGLFHKNIQGHWQAIETGGVGLGVPDSNFCIENVEGWVEFKQTSIFAVGMRREQVGWLMKRSRYGGRCFIAVRNKHEGGPRKGDPIDDLLIYKGSQAREVMDQGIRTPPLSSWSGGPALWDWDAVRDLLILK